MAASGSFTWDDSEIAKSLITIPDAAHRALSAVVRFHATTAVAHARSTAKWVDRTSNARNGLTSRAVIEKGKTYGFVLAHGVEYGIWLEVRFSGRYAVIGPTIEKEARDTMQDASRIFGALR